MTPRTQLPPSSIQITFKSYESEPIETAIQNLLWAIRETSYQHPRIIRFPTKKELYTVVRSPHVHKKSRDQFHRNTFKASVHFSPFVSEELVGIIKHIKLRGVQIAWTIRYATPYSPSM